MSSVRFLLSSASEKALQTAEQESHQSGSGVARPAHLLIALRELCELDLETLFQTEDLGNALEEARDEVRKLRLAMGWTGVGAKASRRRLLSLLDGAESTSSIDDDSEVLKLANKRRAESGDRRIRLLHLLRAVIETDWEPREGLLAEMRIQKGDLLKRAAKLSTEEPAGRKIRDTMPLRGTKPGLRDTLPMGSNQPAPPSVETGTMPAHAAKMTSLPLAEAVMVLDICDSSGIGHRHGDEMLMHLKRAVEESALAAATRNRVSFTKGTGDGFLMTFASCEQAVATAQRILEDLRRYNEAHPSQIPIRLRFGINFGEVRAGPGGDRIGNTVNLAFRVQESKAEDMHETRTGIRKQALPAKDRILVTHHVFKELSAAESPHQCLKVGYFDYKGFEGTRIAVYEIRLPR